MDVRGWYVCYIRYQCWSPSMAVSKEALIRTMNTIVSDLEQEGLIDNYFRMCEDLKDVNGPYYFANLLVTFIADTQNAILELTRLLIGACALARAWLNLREGTQNENKARCISSMNEVRHEFERIHARLDAIVQLERDIVRW
ncbi:uncharacterized protein [Spinacia oleracea]|uniref:Histidine-containing phosphotransfer protein n=1 Tax=Spinacia oleracea TaxID=3562 RepID=A0ABM3QNT0_SPIOL|nr:uncharacterized protein LOC130461103 isoform X2 [Spinacia oleracea]